MSYLLSAVINNKEVWWKQSLFPEELYKGLEDQTINLKEKYGVDKVHYQLFTNNIYYPVEEFEM